jgi:hypothetical protein
VQREAGPKNLNRIYARSSNKVTKQKNTKSEWVSKNVEARKLMCMEEHHKSRSREKAVARADKKKGACPTEKGGDAEGSKGTRRTRGRSDDRHGLEDAGVATGVRNCEGQEVCG